MDEMMLTNIFEHADTPDPIAQSVYCFLGEVLNIHHYYTQYL